MTEETLRGNKETEDTIKGWSDFASRIKGQNMDLKIEIEHLKSKTIEAESMKKESERNIAGEMTFLKD